jgi:transposase/regulator of replication initiation timing
MFESINDIEHIVKTVLFRNRELSRRVTVLEKEKATLESKNATLTAENTTLAAENTGLRERLSILEKPPKDSSNSSISPSKESIKAQAVRRTQSLRTPSGRKSGGQPGHKGSTLLMSDSADETKVHASQYCTACGLSLASIQGKESEIRQSVDIPLPICPIVTNHVRIDKVCTCGKCNRGTFPDHVKPGVSYGVNLHATVAYLSTVQHIPFKRLTETIKDFYGIELSQGTISNMLNRMRKQSDSAYEAIRRVIETSPVVGGDETGVHITGKLHWMWVFQNALVTYVFQHASRGKAAMDEHFPKGFPQSVLVTDRHRSYFNMDTAGHQLCLAHLLRELIYLGELNKEQKWSPALLDLFRESIHQRKQMPFEQIDVEKIKERFAELMKQNLQALADPYKNLQKSLTKHSDSLFRFLENMDVPYENNASERAIRPLKVKQKVSGMFKSDQGGETFCQLHSIANTAKKNKQEPFQALIAVAENILKKEQIGNSS